MDTSPTDVRPDGMKFSGVIIPIVTPFGPDDTIDEVAFAAVIDEMIAAGASGIVVGGTTGEYYAMTVDERRRQLEIAATLVAGRATLIAGCTVGGAAAAVDLACHAAQLGYDAVMLSAPPTSLPTQQELAAYVLLVAEQSALPVVLYNYPARAGVEYGFECLDLIADHAGVVALKESSGDFSRMIAIRHRYAGRVPLICGSDDQAFDYMMWGTTAWLAGTANVLPRQHVAFVETMLAGDVELARRQFDVLMPFLQYMESGRYNNKVKGGMNHLGLAVGDVRGPLLALSAAEQRELGAVIDATVTAFAALPGSSRPS
ncbi:MAG: dihydrodipicolinate synthase family protein [Ilumatobacteraceae bacterium]